MAQVDIKPQHDSYCYQASASTNYGSSEDIWIRTLSVNDDLGFLRWSDLSDVPGGAIIDSATLYIYCKTVYSGGVSDVLTKLCDNTWDESTINYSNMPGVTGDNIHTFDFTSTGWKNCGGDMTQTVKDWISGDTDNYGIRLFRESDQSTYSILSSSEHSSYEPYLRIVYTMPGGAFLMFLSEAWQRHNKLWTPKLILPKENYC